ncbi:hypothetical protein Clacol_006491 [Clathrus columnatus]|uniref:Postreplication repair E3 ubiquitin-protein ligase RAD18 n=1 Tax=Clathrus columnatus TaxID=1419009 RepID=A0AAV5AJW5_9AGAM|nr:hypothetical protein Clacol_006491 [Clathrus columnatus]
MDPHELADVTDPSDFPLEVLKKLDSTFRCTICKEFFEAPVLLTQCGHTFCSLCIRNQLPNKPECPLCKKATKETHLVRNVMFGEAIDTWCKAREDIESIPSTSKRKLDDVICIYNSTSEAEEDISSKPKKRKTKEEVSCPICFRHVLMSSINSHIDNGCKGYLAREDPKLGGSDKLKSKAAWNSIFKQDKRKIYNSPQDSEIPDHDSKLPKVSYGTLTLSGLKTLLSDFGLSTTGDKDALIARHERWIAIYNANLDRAHPKSLGELKTRLEEVEETVNRPAPKRISDEKDWTKKNQDQFKSLIEQAGNGAKRKRGDDESNNQNIPESSSERSERT